MANRKQANSAASFGRFLSHNGVRTLLFFFLILSYSYFYSLKKILSVLPYKSFGNILWIPVQYFYGIRACVNKWVLTSSPFPVPSRGLFSFCLFVLSYSYSDGLGFVLSYFIFYYFLLKACLFPKERQKWGGSWWEGRSNWEEQKVVYSGNQDILQKKKHFQ